MWILSVCLGIYLSVPNLLTINMQISMVGGSFESAQEKVDLIHGSPISQKMSSNGFSYVKKTNPTPSKTLVPPRPPYNHPVSSQQKPCSYAASCNISEFSEADPMAEIQILSHLN